LSVLGKRKAMCEIEHNQIQIFICRIRWNYSKTSMSIECVHMN